MFDPLGPLQSSGVRVALAALRGRAPRTAAAAAPAAGASELRAAVKIGSFCGVSKLYVGHSKKINIIKASVY